MGLRLFSLFSFFLFTLLWLGCWLKNMMKNKGEIHRFFGVENEILLFSSVVVGKKKKRRNITVVQLMMKMRVTKIK
jgi:hypothetical protein